jgi:hypothetical protein
MSWPGGQGPQLAFAAMMEMGKIDIGKIETTASGMTG